MDNLTPGPNIFYLLKNLPRMKKDLLGLLRDLVTQYGDAVQIRLGFVKIFIFNHPDHFEHILKKNWLNYPKSNRYHLFRPTVGKGLLLAEGKVWTHKRRVAQPAFHLKKISTFVPRIVEQAEEMTASWKSSAQSGKSIEVQYEMLKLLFQVASYSLFGAALTPNDALTFHTNLMFVMGELEKRALSPMPWLASIPSPRKFRFLRHMQELDKIVYSIIDNRGETAGQHDLLALLMNTKTEEGKPELNRTQLRDEVMSLLIGGYETSTNVLTWALYQMARNPEMQMKLHQEIIAKLPDGKAMTWDDVKEMEFLNAVVDETMRKYPPVWMTTRQAIESDVVNGHHVPKGSLVVISYHLLHHHPVFWERPDDFDPGRFMGEKKNLIPKFTFIPFSAGPRECIGKNFAMMDIPLILATVLRHYRVTYVPGADPYPVTTMTFRPSQKIYLKLEKV